MNEPDREAPYAVLAVSFADALVAGHYDVAHEMLCSGFREVVSPQRLEEIYSEMVDYGEGPPTAVELIVTMTEWPARQNEDLGWAYVSISGEDFAEAVTVVVQAEAGEPKIREIEWGRP